MDHLHGLNAVKTILFGVGVRCKQIPPVNPAITVESLVMGNFLSTQRALAIIEKDGSDRHQSSHVQLTVLLIHTLQGIGQIPSIDRTDPVRQLSMLQMGFQGIQQGGSRRTQCTPLAGNDADLTFDPRLLEWNENQSVK